MRPTLRPRRAGHVLLRAATQRMPKERKIGIGTPYEQSIDIEKKKEKRRRNDNSCYNRIIYVPRNNTDNLPFSIRYFHVFLSIEKLFSR